ncbi:zinc finger, C2H2-like protein [Artemisia annua]|uniref:Zinc finger, C2H2-like protein n=1 Tax=Artemisia annua TaxID=35608 RepID=A0A2U1ME55_ARTAN|nr:zinc finger, C2H2-like protein [Artemisia annua]
MGQPEVFECTSCKKVFGSLQALGGHRAAITRVGGGQALGGHKRCHREKEDYVVQAASTSAVSQGWCNLNLLCRLDLNKPVPREDYLSRSNVGLDLRLGL